MKLPLFVLIGPTAVGKTKISIQLAKVLQGEIISGDSMQVYKYLDIGTAKIKPEEMEGIPHHLIDIKEPEENFSVAEFQKLAHEKIKEINIRKKLPMLVGGTGLYINSVINENYNFSPTGNTEKIREKLWQEVEEKGIDNLLSKLKEVDPLSAEKIHPHDTKRIIRALEVYYTTGKPFSSFQKTNNHTTSKYNLVMVGLNMDRDKLYQRINLRVEKMLEEGWVEEVKKVLKSGISPNAPALQGLGYRQLIMYLKGEISFEEAVDLIKRDTRRFAKRQLTWFRRDKRIHWIDVTDKKEKEILQEILFFTGRSIKNNVEVINNLS